MVKIAVTIVGTLGWGLGVWLIVRYWSTERVAPPDLSDAPRRERFLAVSTRVAGSVAGGVVAGVLTIGLGGRLVMRLLAATSSSSAQGRLTEAEEIVGEVTVDGTVGFVVFIGLFGGFVGLLLFSVLRRWLPTRSVVAGLLTVAIGAGLLARPSALLDPASPDFDILEPLWVAVPVIVLLLASYGALGGVLIDRWAATWPSPNSARGAVGLLPVAPLLVFGLPGVLLAVAVLFGVFAGPTLRRSASLASIDRVGRVTVPAAGVAGAIWILITSGEILTG